MTLLRTTVGGRAWIEIDHAALLHNLGVLRALAGGRQQVIAVVKANAYGHGDVEVARSLVAGGAERLAVATLDEARRLRDAGVSAPIVLLWAFGAGDVTEVVDLDLEPMVDRMETVSELAEAAEGANRRIGVHLKVDTGLQRQGATPDEALEVANRVARGGPSLVLAGTMTHLAAPGEDEAFTDAQVTRFGRLLDGLASIGIDPGLVHLSATGGILAGVGGFASAIRPGLGLYGLLPSWVETEAAAGRIPAPGLRPVLSLRTYAVRVHDVSAGTPVGYGLRWRAQRDSRLATLPIGYGDGWPRVHVNNGFALVRGQRVPVVGAVSMDGLVVDVTDVAEVGMDDEFVLLGSQGSASITVSEVAAQRRTIGYEVTTALRQRIARRPRPVAGTVS